MALRFETFQGLLEDSWLQAADYSLCHESRSFWRPLGLSCSLRERSECGGSLPSGPFFRIPSGVWGVASDLFLDRFLSLLLAFSLTRLGLILGVSELELGPVLAHFGQQGGQFDAQDCWH